jgi:hypothetical protein
MAIAEEAAYQEHSYLRDGGRELRPRRAVRSSRLVQRILDPPGDLVLLGMLRRDELQTLRNELQTLRNAGEQLISVLPPFHEALQEAQQLATSSPFEDGAFTDFREVFATFLYEKPDDYPEIAEVVLSDEHRAALHTTYHTRLNWFRADRKRPNDLEKYVEEPLETGARERLLQAHGQLIPARLQPIPFIGAARPEHYTTQTHHVAKPSYRDFALLFDEDTHEYVAALWMRGSKDPVTPAELQERQAKRANQKHRGRLRYANFPETRFEPSDRTSYLLLPLEWGEQSNRRRFREQRQPLLRHLIDQQREQQLALHASVNTEAHPVPSAMCLPEHIPFTSAKLVMQWDEHGEPKFFLHLVVTMPATKPRHIPETVMGFHEHDEGYSFVELQCDGTVVRVGDLTIPPHADPTQGAKRSDNYQYEVVHAMLRQADAALIGLEATGWKKDRPALSRAHNRKVFGQPSASILHTLQYKGRQAQVLEPRTIQGVSPARDCSRCGVRHPPGTRCLERRLVVICPNPACQAWQIWQTEEDEQRCPQCHHVWQAAAEAIVAEQYFVCPICQHPALLARHNTAIVVAQETLCQLVAHYRRAKKREEARQKRQGTSQGPTTPGADSAQNQA